jgi:uncharacterized repeat protein (TIGR01451 family)
MKNRSLPISHPPTDPLAAFDWTPCPPSPDFCRTALASFSFPGFERFRKLAWAGALGFFASILIAPPALAVTEAFTGNTLVNTWTLTANSTSSACLTVAGGTRPCPASAPDYNDADGEGWLRLTTNANTQSARALLAAQFPLSQGFDLIFTYATYGTTPATSAADGIAVFLVDASVPGAGTGGGTGGTLGYHNVAGGVLGIGLDEYGNFTDPTFFTDGPGRQQSNISVRAGQNAPVPWSYLGGTSLAPADLLTDSAWVYPATQPCASGEACQRTGKTMRVSFYPDTTCPGPNEYRILVESISDNAIDFNHCVSATDLGITDPNMNVSLGFSSGTGGSRAYHEIRMVDATSVADLVVTRTDSGVYYTPGQNDSYAMTIHNNGPANADGSIFAATLPPGLDTATVTIACAVPGGSAAVCPTGPLTVAAVTSGIVIPVFPVGGSLVFTFTGRMLNSATGNQDIEATIAPPPGGGSGLGLASPGVGCRAAGSDFEGATSICTAQGTHIPSGLPPPPPPAVPAVNELALALLALMLTGLGVVAMRRGKRA